MTRIVKSFFMATLILSVTSICHAETLRFTNDDLIKYDSKPMPTTERGDQTNSSRRQDQMINDKTYQTHAPESAKYISESDKNIIIKRCKEAWNLYRSALSRGDVEDALKYVSNKSKSEFSGALRNQQRPTDALGDITTAEVIEVSIARFKMRAKSKLQSGDSVPPGYSVGDSISYDGYVVFTKDADDKWLVDFY